MENLLNIKNLSYQRNLHSILKDLNLELPQGEIVGLLGANGAGKTTLMRLIAGSYFSRQGSIMINGDSRLPARKKAVSFTEQISTISNSQRLFKIAEDYQLMYPDFDLSRFNHLLDTLNLKLDARLNQLSKGNQRKFVIAITLARQTDLYLLDEPFDGIDGMSRKKIISSIIGWKPENATIIISDHHVTDIANLLDEVVIVRDQRVIAQERADTIRETLGKDIESYYEDFYKEDVEYD